ncbi:MAG: SMC-Scp complex subunit ScpB [Minwuia sp.]|uniref:SMC-Scp complex subunit ScpB n=1 Tax=Minwuia sp. TaxID=2493630 RepID=UPI003A8648B3
MSVDRDHVRIAEALLFAASEPLDLATIAKRLPDSVDASVVMAALAEDYRGRGVEPVRVGEKWMFRTAPDLADALAEHRVTPRKLSRAAVETLSIIAYHQPITRAEIEELRGVAVSKGTMDVLMETAWVRPRGRRQTPGRPVTYGTTDEFLIHFGLSNLNDLPGIDELKATGLLSAEPKDPGLFDGGNGNGTA